MSSLNRREFMKALGAGAAGGMLFSSGGLVSGYDGSGIEGVRLSRTLRVKPVLVYQLYKRKKQVSWRWWGGLHNKQDVDAEMGRIEGELKQLTSSADFGLEFLQVSKVTNEEEASVAGRSDCDVFLIYAASGGHRGEFEAILSSGKSAVMFLRHKSGPVYLWYEIAHPMFLRKNGDEQKKPCGMNVWDIVVDDYEEVLWRLRALHGLLNAQGTRIVAVGGPGGWGKVGTKAGPATAKELWKLDIETVSYKHLEAMIKDVKQDKKAIAEAERKTKEYLGQGGVSLHTDRKFVVNAFLLKKVFEKLMQEAKAPALTIHGCMVTIIPMAETTACMPLSFLNDEGYSAFCESDFAVIPSGILLRYISGKPAFLNDPTYPHDGVVTCAHCTAPRKMNGRDFEPAKIVTHYESDYGAAPKVQMRKGQVITAVVPSFTSEKWIGMRARIIDHPFYDICRSQIDIEIEGDWKKLLEDMQGFHWMICYGDYLRETGYAVKKLGIEWENISDA